MADTVSASDTPTGFAVVGDYGMGNQYAAGVADMIRQQNVPASSEAFIVTTGDNRYTSSGYISDDNVYESFNQAVCGNDSYTIYKDFLPLNLYPALSEQGCPDASQISPPPADICATSLGDAIDMQDINFYPVPGNHDVSQNDLSGYTAYFPWARQVCAATVCTDEMADRINDRYENAEFSCDLVPENTYDVQRGDTHLFMLDTTMIGTNSDCTVNDFTPAMCNDADVSLTDVQQKICAQGYWMEDVASQSTATWKLSFQHHSPYSASNHGSCPAVQYDFQGYGLDASFSGHSHLYERIEVVDLNTVIDHQYIISGGGGYVLDNVCSNIGDLGPATNYRGEDNYIESVSGYNGETSSKHGWGAVLGKTSDVAMSLGYFTTDTTNPQGLQKEVCSFTRISSDESYSTCTENYSNVQICDIPRD